MNSDKKRLEGQRAHLYIRSRELVLDKAGKYRIGNATNSLVQNKNF